MQRSRIMEENTQSLGAGGRTASDLASESAAVSFSRSGYLVQRNLVSGPVLAFLQEYVSKIAQFGKTLLEDANAPGAPTWTGDAIMEAFLEAMTPSIEIATGRKLFPTYACFRVYKRGDILQRHVDRVACEISVSLSLGYKGDQNWPIWLERDGQAQSFTLEPGDGLIYKGVEMPHWRDRCTGESAAQVFMHYVDQKGPFKDWIYDKRPNLSATPVTRQLLSGFGPFCVGGRGLSGVNK